MEDDEKNGHPRSHIIDENIEKVQIWCSQIFTYQSYGCASKFGHRNSEKGLNFGSTIGFSTMTMFQLTRHFL
jgi:hypothetical protein